MSSTFWWFKNSCISRNEQPLQQLSPQLGHLTLTRRPNPPTTTTTVLRHANTSTTNPSRPMWDKTVPLLGAHQISDRHPDTGGVSSDTDCLHATTQSCPPVNETWPNRSLRIDIYTYKRARPRPPSGGGSGGRAILFSLLFFSPLPSPLARLFDGGVVVL